MIKASEHPEATLGELIKMAMDADTYVLVDRPVVHPPRAFSARQPYEPAWLKRLAYSEGV